MAKFSAVDCPYCGRKIHSSHGRFHVHYLPKKQRILGMRCCPESCQLVEKPKLEEVVQEVVNEHIPTS